jgi:glycyl-tRNA synthetase beta chain
MVAAQKRLEALGQVVGMAEFAPLATTFKRVANIVDKQGRDEAGPIDAAKLVEEAERALHRALLAVRNALDRRVTADDYAGALREIAGLKAPVDAFFDKVMVIAEDKTLRANRIALLRQVRALFNQVADFSKIQLEPVE